ncbi:MAG: SusD/RagB family nutrient-binding outer membrane lipoprotein [Spirosomataceae bacterium]
MKKYIKKSIQFLLAGTLVFSAGSCGDMFDLNINTDPNNPSTADIALLLPSAQLNLSGLFEGVSQTTLGLTGIFANSDSFGFTNNSFNGTWNSFYQNGMKDLDEIIKATTDNNPRNLAVAQVMKAYFMGSFVDLFGDAPYTEAWQGNATTINLNPKFDSGKDIYDDCIKLCDQAVANLAKPGAAIKGDLYYNGSVASWTTLANTVKLRLLINSRRVRSTAAAEIKAILDGGNIIKTAANDFQFRYNKLANPDGRHPWYSSAYAGATDNGFTYILHQIMYDMIDLGDPRLPFYFRRQTSTILDQNDPTSRSTTPCSQQAGCKYAYMVLNPAVIKALYTDKGKTATAADLAYLAGFFGRDRGDISGVPQDVNLRTVPGCYPAAGAYDRATASKSATSASQGSGDGIFPMITTWMVKYYQIEAILTLGISGDAKALFEAAMREQITKVVNMGLASDPNNAKAPTAAEIDKYVKIFLDRYDAAPTNEAKLNLVLKQAWYSNYGNGNEIYNAFRRTGYPSDIQVPVARYRNYPLRLPQPAQETSLNKSAPQTPVAFDTPSAAVFWDVVKFAY